MKTSDIPKAEEEKKQKKALHRAFYSSMQGRIFLLFRLNHFALLGINDVAL